MADWKTDLRTLADKLRADQKNKKGFQSKFKNVVGYKKKKGFNDTGIPLTAKAAKSLRRNKASYRGRYIGTTLQQINEERKAAAKDRWKHLRAGPRHSTDTGQNRTKDYSVSQMKWRNSVTSRVDRGWSNQSTPFKGTGYSNPPSEEKEEINYTWSEPKIKDAGADYKEGKFPKLDEAIRNLKKGKR